MRKLSTFILSGCLVTILSGCGMKQEVSNSMNGNKQTYDETKEILPSIVFESDLKNESLTKSEIHKSIQRYLDTNESIYKVTSNIEEKVWDEKPLTQKEAKQLKESRKLLRENDQNFSQYIENNQLPKGYKKETKRLSTYFTTYNKTIGDMDDKVQKIQGQSEKGKIPTKEIKDLHVDTSKVNGREQAKIEKFLKQIKVKTNAFKK
ncbi:NDxxF motif lipoprotein [Mammaliicoccus sp. Dog046]|uniref:NDxxF motif lipoprotein n=1 Tax=Mammaliicoccus sp. Dog046 TaxID=3034233 RepID=UPI002B25F89A|nr:NDxxF motif lipoprotein [Mammaliicoccus sp. Dog046]WQK85709.1 NDxxF motif lipoprotein [Mammaliicoccus sp. Dog046]